MNMNDPPVAALLCENASHPDAFDGECIAIELSADILIASEARCLTAGEHLDTNVLVPHLHATGLGEQTLVQLCDIFPANDAVGRGDVNKNKVGIVREDRRECVEVPTLASSRVLGEG